MPCRYDPTPAEIKQMEDQKNAALIKPYIDKLDAATRVACELAGMLYGTRIWGKASPETKNWFAEHREADRKRIENERANAIAKAKLALTPEQMKLLGIPDA